MYRYGLLAGVLGLGLVLQNGAAAEGQTRQERLLAALDSRFASADLDRDGLLSAAEAEGGMPYVHRHFATIDSTGSGGISLQQVHAFIAQKAAERMRARQF